MANRTPVALVAAQLASAWDRWSLRSSCAKASAASGGAAGGAASVYSSQQSADEEAQYELVAMGLTATLSDAQIQQLFDTKNDILTLVLPLQGSFARDARKFHFTLVVLTKLVSQVLESASGAEGIASPAAATQWRRFVDDLLLPLLRFQQYARVHKVALAMLDQIVAAGNAALTEPLAAQVLAILVQEAAGASLGDDVDHLSAEDQTVSFSSLCGVLQLLLQGDSAEEPSSILVGQIKQICSHAISRFETAPRFLRAVSTQLVPALLRADPKMAQRLTWIAMDAWRATKDSGTTSSSSKFESNSMSNVMYLLCLLLPNDPLLIQESGLQEMIAFALASADPLVRKQGMYLLKIAFSHYVLDAETSSSTPGSTKTNAAVLETWQSFITASEVIQMHHEQHLIEQVWPQVAFLIESSLVVLQTDDGEPTASPAVASSGSADTWPVEFSFEWIQTLLIRVFSHENPIVRRLFLSNFMQACLKQWEATEAKLRALDSAGNSKKTTTFAVDTDASFLCNPSFRAFVFDRLMPSLNDPLMYKSSTKEAFQHVISRFLAAFLRFQFLWMKNTERRSEAPTPGLMKTYVCAIDQAIFGPASVGHSPEALLSMLEVFEDAKLQATVKSNRNAFSVSAGDLLDEEAIETLRFIVQVHVMRSFPQSIRVKTLRSLEHALTGGFTDTAEHSLHSVANILSVFPVQNLIGCDGSTYLSIHQWLHPRQEGDAAGRDGKATHFPSTLTRALASYLHKADGAGSGSKALSAAQLSRLLLFTADVETPVSPPAKVNLQAPLGRLVKDMDAESVDSSKLLHFVGTFEEEVQQLIKLSRTKSVQAHFVFSFSPRSFYCSKEEEDHAFLFSSKSLFETGLRASTHWMNSIHAHENPDGGVVDDDEDDLDEDNDAEEDKHALLAASALVVTQMSTYSMEQDGDLHAMDALNAFCGLLKSTLSSAKMDVNASDQTIALRYLAIVSSNTQAIDALDALQGETMLPLVLGAQPTRPRLGKGSQHFTRCVMVFFTSKWRLLHNVLRATSYVPTQLLHRVFAECLDAISAVGDDPLVLYEMVQVLALSLAQLAAALVKADDSDARLDDLFQEVWGAYSECKSKPDILTRAVVHCLFQPAFLLSEALSGGKDATMKRWFRRFMRFGEAHRPNVIFHLTCRLAQVWRALPHSALWFVDEIILLLLYKEPLIDEKEQLTLSSSGGADGDDGMVAVAGSSGLLAKNKFVRLVVVSFLDEICVDTAGTTTTGDSNEHRLLSQLTFRLLELNMDEEWKKQHMINSDGFGKKIRCWQTLCVLSKHVDGAMIDKVSELLWKAFVFPHLPAMRYYMEIFAMRMIMRFPSVTIRKYVVPLLQNYNLMPQVGASLLVVAGYAIYHRLDGHFESDHALNTLLLEAMLPWLNSSHGHTRTLVQFMLANLLPRYLHQQLGANSSSSSTTLLPSMDLQFLKQTASFLSQNKEAKRLHRRQANQLSRFHPEFECSLLGVLSSSRLNEFLELFPTDEVLLFSTQFKTSMNELYAQFQRENFEEDTPSAKSSPDGTNGPAPLPAAAAGTMSLNVQRKIDTSAILLDESVLPVAMQEREVVDLNVRNKKRQQVILCASLVDKIPNLAGLARTCEIFNASKLVVPNMRACEDEMFATISVTANKWMPMEEVRPENGDLVKALASWKQQGYTIVAVEQTSSSVCLSSYQFPEKIVIVLGKEKEGIPVDVLQMVDVCVEIPQFGLIRSLNVHVSGAILLWEYTQQQLLQRAAI